MAYFVFDAHYHLDQNKAELIGAKQMESFKTWLLEKKDRAVFKLLVSPAAWTLNLSGGTTWRNFEQERNQVLDFIEEHDIQGCIFVSGDAHVVGVFELRKGMIEISASPFAASSPPFNTFGNNEDKTLFMQPEFKIGDVNQYALYNITTAETGSVAEISIMKDRLALYKIRIFPNGEYESIDL